MERQEFRSKLEDLMPAEELLFQPTPGFGPFYKPFLDHAIAHPAKMNTWLLEWLIKAFTKPGETVLDPMAGSGSTGVIAALHGRNAVQVELEKRFYEWMEKARENVEKNTLIQQKGWIKNICGDARRLSQLLQCVDICITSPPYSEGIGHDSGDNASEQFKERLEMQRRYTRQMISEGNIANLPLGKMDAVITSPPFGDGYSIREGGQVCKEYVERRRQKLIEQGRKDIAENLRLFEYSARNPTNIGNLPLGNVDAVITSPPFGDSYTGGGDSDKRKERLIKAGHDPKDFLGGKARNAVLKHYSEVDTVITSPPYSENMTKKRKGYTVIPELEKTREMPQDTRDDNIANLPHGNIAAIITSPPYERQHEGGCDTPKVSHGCVKERYSSGNNIGNLPLGNVDAIITSPPYGEAQQGSGIVKHGYQGSKHSPTDLVGKRSYMPDKFESAENISKLPHGNIDAVITSPPYGDGKKAGEVKPEEVEKYARRWEENVEERGWNSWGKSFHTSGRLRGIQALRDGYSENRENIGNLPYFDCCITSPPYEASVSDGKESPMAGGDEKKYGRWRKGTARKHSYMQHGEPCKVDTVITSPPYEGSLEGTTRHTRGGIASRNPALAQTGSYATVMSFGVPVGYSPNKDNIGNMKKETYLEAMLKVYAEMFKVLKPDGLAIIVVKPFIRNKKVVDLPYHTWLLMARVGFRLAKLYKLRLKQQSFWRILLYKKHPDVPLIAHEYVLVCRKPGSEPSEVEPQISPLDFVVEMAARETALKIGA